MNCEPARERMMEWLDGRLSCDAANQLKAHVDGCPACQAELAATRRIAALLEAPPRVQPSPSLRESVFAAIAAEQAAVDAADRRSGGGRGRPRRRSPWFALVQALGACALLALGYWAGVRRSAFVRHEPAGGAADLAARQEIADLRARLDSMGQMVSYTLAEEQRASTNQRLVTVLATGAEAKPDAHAIDSLITTLALDPSVNVRLSAVQALYAHADRADVRAAIAVSLPRESSPLVQLAMIDFLAAAKDAAASPVLEKLSTSAADPSVREAAARAFSELAPNHF